MVRTVEGMDARATIRQTYLVEHYRPGFTVEALQQCATRIRLAADEVGREGKPVRYVRSTIVPADESLLCLLEAATEGLVHETYARGHPLRPDLARNSGSGRGP